MRRPIRTVWLVIGLVLLAVALVVLFYRARPAGGQGPARVLLVTATAGFYHSSIPVAREVIQRLGQEGGDFGVTLASDEVGLGLIRPSVLAAHDVVVFANTSGELPLDDDQKRALLEFVAGGGGFVGTHSASDTFYGWAEYGELLGAYFKEHPWTQAVGIVVEDPAHPITAGLEAPFELADEIYVFRSNPRGRSRVLLSLDPGSVGAVGDFPLAWCHGYGVGRVFYSALGHHDAVWQDERFRRHLQAAILWAAGRLPGGCEAN